MKKFLTIIGIVSLSATLLQGCGEDLKQAQDNIMKVKTDAETSINKAKEEVEKVHNNIKETKEKIEDKIDKANKVIDSIKEFTE